MYKLAGQFTVWSILQGGQGPKCLSSNIHEFVEGRKVDEKVICDEIDDEKLKEILVNLDKVQEEAFNSFLDTYADCICSYGYVNIYMAKYGDKADICNSLLHQYFKFSVLAEMQQFKDGMNTIGNFGVSVFRNKSMFDLVLSHKEVEINWKHLEELFDITYSEEGSNNKNGETETIYAWQLYLQDINDKEVSITYGDLLVFITGADNIPPLGFANKPCIEFYDLDGSIR